MIALPPSLFELARTFLPATLADSLAQATVDQAIRAEVNTQLEAVVARLGPFAPPTVLRATTTDAGHEVNGRYMRGSVVLTQFVGIHQLLRQVARFDREGSELLVTLLNQIIGTLNEEITTRGGDLARVSGDELTIVFDEAQFGSQHAELAATTALAMQERMQAFASVQIQAEKVQIQLRVAVHSGSFFVGEVGDATHKEYLISGLTIANTIQARDTAPPGHVIISDDTLRLLHAPTVESQVRGTHILAALGTSDMPIRQRTRAAMPTVAPPTPTTLLQQIATLLPYQPYGLPERFSRYDSAYGEFRLVTVVVVSFSALKRLLGFVEMAVTINRDAAILGRLIDTYYTTMQTLAQSYDGMVNGVEMSASGDRLVISFGAFAAHDDDPRRAVALALDMRRTMEALKTQITDILSTYVEVHPEQHTLLRLARSVAPVRVGIARGTMFAGLIGTPERHAYAVIGEPLDLANKLMGIALEGDILLSAAVYRAVHTQIEAEPLRTMTIAEFARPMSVFRVRAPRTDGAMPTEPATPLVGRHAELAQFQSLSTQAFASDTAGQITSITGEAGIGKTRMLDELAAIASTTWPDVLQIRETCQSYEHDRPYALMCRLLTPLLGVNPLAPPDEQVTFVQQRVAQLAAESSRFVPLLAPLLGLPIAESKLTQALTPEQRRDRLHDLLAALLLAPAQPLLLMIDDAQWIDPSSAAVIERLSRDVSGHTVFLALAYRTGVAFNQPWNALAHHTPVALEPLTNVESLALLEGLLGTKPPAELQPLVDRANGIPLFLEQLVRYLIDSRMLRRDQAGDWHLTERFRVDSIPIEIEQIIVARIDTLSPEARLVVQLASVVGHPADQQIVAALLPAEQPAPPLAELAQAYVLARQETPTTPMYAFHNTLISDVVYNGLSFARRRELHGQVAAAIERVYQAAIDPWQVAIAQHYLRAEQHNQASPYLLRAAKQAQVRYANQEAIELYTQALYIAPWRDAEIPPDPMIAAPLYEGLGDVLTLTGSYDQAREHYSLLLSLFDSGSAEHALYRATLLRKLASTYESQGNFDTALERLRSAITMVTNAPSTNSAVEEYAEMLSDIGWVYFRRSDLDQAQLYLNQALGLIESEEVTSQTARIFNRLGGIAWQQGDLAKAQGYVEQSLTASEKAGDLVGQAKALNNLSVLTESQGSVDESLEYGIKAINIQEYIGNKREIAISAINVGWALYTLNKNEQAYKYFKKAVDRTSEIGDAYHQMLALLNLGRVLTSMGQREAANQFIQQSQFIAIQLHLPAVQLECYTVLSTIALDEKNIDLAIHKYQLGLQLIIDVESEEYGRFERLEAKLAVAQGNKTRALELLRMNEALFTRLQNIPEANRTRKLLTEIEAPE